MRMSWACISLTAANPHLTFRSDGYEFLMQNCKNFFLIHHLVPLLMRNADTTGDRICIFGFSRGAYTARALAGMLHKVGLLPVCNHQQVPFAYKMYTNTNQTGWEQSNAFKHAFSIDVKIEFIGVWWVLGFWYSTSMFM